MKFRIATVLLLLMTSLAAGEAGAQNHCSELPPLTPDAVFPRCSALEIAQLGFPDHKHAHHWGSWEILTDSLGEYGPGTLCEHKAVHYRDDLIIESDQKSFGQFVLRHNPEYQKCDMIPLLELLDWANHEVPDLLGLATSDTLSIFNPDNSHHYKEVCGYGVWRLYSLDGDDCIIQPYPVLMARTLDGHGAFMLVTDWILHKAIEADLPPWLHQGIVEYVGEDGMHLISYMGEFRPAGSVLLSPAEVDAKLAAGMDPDEGRDREMFRRASYSSFLMVWQLVEHEGGLAALREFLTLAAEGMDLDQASTMVYGMDLGQLAIYLDPVKNGDPIPEKFAPPKPHLEP
jgi:hypothetical protein